MVSFPEGLFKQWTITFNPWNEHHWLKKRFFDVNDDNILAMTTNYLCNEWLDDSDKSLFESMKRRIPDDMQLRGLEIGVLLTGLFMRIGRNERSRLMKLNNAKQEKAGLDFGYTNDPTAFFVGFLDLDAKRLYVWDAIYEKGMSNKATNNKIVAMGYSKERITGDSAEPKSIDELKSMKLRIKGAKKGKDSVMNGVQWIQDLEIIIHPRCTNFITEISNYTWETDKFGNKLNKPIDDFNHLMEPNALRIGRRHRRKQMVVLVR